MHAHKLKCTSVHIHTCPNAKEMEMQPQTIGCIFDLCLGKGGEQKINMVSCHDCFSNHHGYLYVLDEFCNTGDLSFPCQRNWDPAPCLLMVEVVCVHECVCACVWNMLCYMRVQVFLIVAI